MPNFRYDNEGDESWMNHAWGCKCEDCNPHGILDRTLSYEEGENYEPTEEEDDY